MFRLLALVSLSVITSCTASSIDYPASWQATQNGLVVKKAVMSADIKTAEAFITLELVNNTGGVIKANFGAARLAGSNGVSSLPLTITTEDYTVMPGNPVRVKLGYKPENRPDLYQKFRLYGDLQPAYTLVLDFFTDSRDNPLPASEIQFTANTGVYSKAIKNYGLDSSFHEFSVTADTNTLIPYLKDYIKKSGMLAIHSHAGETEGHVHDETCGHEKDDHGSIESTVQDFSMFMSGSEIYIDRWYFKITAYQTGSTLKVYMKTMNRFPKVLLALMDRFAVKINGQVYKPVRKDLTQLKKILSPLNTNVGPDALVMGLNDRAEWTLDFNVTGLKDKFELHLGGFVNENSNIIFNTNLLFEAVKS